MRLFGRDDASDITLSRFEPLLDAGRVWTTDPAHRAFFNAETPEILKTSDAEDVRAGQRNALGPLETVETDRAGVRCAREGIRTSRLIISRQQWCEKAG